MIFRAAVLSALVAASGPVLAQTQPTPSAAATGVGAPIGSRRATELVERYITDLHGRLGIKPGQGPQWDAFAAVMRDNAARQEAAYNDRNAQTVPLNAVDDLRGFAAMERARAADVDRLVPAFDALYQAMDPTQRAQADKVFQDVQRGRNRGRG